MSRGLVFVVRCIIAIFVIVVVARFLGFTWADVDNFIDNGMMRAMKVLGLLKGAAHMPLG